MKKTELAEDEEFTSVHFDLPDVGPIAVQSPGALASKEQIASGLLLDKFLTAVKWVFLYLPGTGALHLTFMALSLFFLYEGPTIEVMLGTFGVFIVGMFMVMLGVGRLTDLRYLRVVGAISIVSTLAAILYSILTVFIPGDFFGTFTRLTLPAALLAGYLVKRNTDHSD